MVVVSGVNLVKQLLPTYLKMLSHLLHSMVNLYWCAIFLFHICIISIITKESCLVHSMVILHWCAVYSFIFIFFSSLTNAQNYGMQGKNGYLHAPVFLLNGMDLQLFWLQQAWLELVVMKTKLLKTWGLVLLILCAPFSFDLLLESHCVICRLTCYFQISSVEKGHYYIIICTIMLL